MIAPEVQHVIAGQLGLVIVRAAGEGAFKKTYKAKNSEGMIVALKIHDPAKVSLRIKRELEAMTRCSHANIVKLFSAGVVKAAKINYLCTVEEFCDGGSLEDRLKIGLLRSPDLKRLAVCLGGALEELATHRLVHRDIKPANIMYRGNSRDPVLVDFGLVRDLEQSSLTGTWQMVGPGTPLYSSPEQLGNEKANIDWRSDQFSLGLTLFTAAVGHHPFKVPDEPDERAVERVMARAKMPARSLLKVRETSLAPLQRMLGLYPIERYRTPRELINAWR